MILKGECNIKSGKRSFTGLDTAEPHHILCNDNANECNKSLLLYCRVPLILCNDNANECNKSLLLYCRVPLILCKDTAKEVRHKRILFIFKM